MFGTVGFQVRSRSLTVRGSADLRRNGPINPGGRAAAPERSYPGARTRRRWVYPV